MYEIIHKEPYHTGFWVAGLYVLDFGYAAVRYNENARVGYGDVWQYTDDVIDSWNDIYAYGTTGFWQAGTVSD